MKNTSAPVTRTFESNVPGSGSFAEMVRHSQPRINLGLAIHAAYNPDPPSLGDGPIIPLWVPKYRAQGSSRILYDDGLPRRPPTKVVIHTGADGRLYPIVEVFARNPGVFTR